MTDETHLRADSAQIERLLDELRELVVPAAWQRIEQVMRITVALHGAGLAHALELARRAGAGAELDELAANDEVLSSLLLLHGLHPHTTEQRVQRTIEALRAELGLAETDLAIGGLAGNRLELVVSPTLGGGAMSARVAESAIRHALEAAAPELAAIELTGLAPVPDRTLVQLRTRREAP
jgi:hypothetical protein